jgi:hypothetical protein
VIVGVSVIVNVGVIVGVSVLVGVGVTVGVAVAVGVSVGVSVAVALGESVGVGVIVGVGRRSPSAPTASMRGVSIEFAGSVRGTPPVFIRDSTSAGVSAEDCCSMSAATPAACGDAIDVPERLAVPPAR